MTFELICPECGGTLPYVKAKTNIDKTIRIWQRRCGLCGTVVTDTGVYSRGIEYAPEHAPLPQLPHPDEGGMKAKVEN